MTNTVYDRHIFISLNKGVDFKVSIGLVDKVRSVFSDSVEKDIVIAEKVIKLFSFDTYGITFDLSSYFQFKVFNEMSIRDSIFSG